MARRTHQKFSSRMCGMGISFRLLCSGHWLHDTLAQSAPAVVSETAPPGAIFAAPAMQAEELV